MLFFHGFITEIISLNIPHTLIHDSSFIGSFCYGIMSQAIRSEVDKQIISLCCRVLLNLARYKPTRQNVFQVSAGVNSRKNDFNFSNAALYSKHSIHSNRFIISKRLPKSCTDGAIKTVISSTFSVHCCMCSFKVQSSTR